MAISVQVRLNAILKEYSPTKGQSSFQLSLPEKSRVEDVIRALKLPREKVGLAAINLRCADLSHALCEGDEVILFPRLPVGG
jgi:molybdopterin converting factor small subunit